MSDIPEPKHTPIPTTGVELASAVARIDDRTKQMTEVHLPRVERIATEARDRVVDLNSRVTIIEENPHECDEKDRQLRQDTSIIDSKEKIVKHSENIKHLYGLKSWFLAIIGSVATGAIVFALSTRSTEATNTANIESNKEDIARHEEVIKNLPGKSDIVKLGKAVAEIPQQVQKSIAEEELSHPTAEEVEDAAGELPLKSYELKQLKMILGKAKQREQEEEETFPAAPPIKGDG